MDGRPTARLKMMLLIVFLSAITGWLHGSQITDVDHRLHCVNDYMYTVRCTLSITAENNSSYWLSFTETYDLTHYVCKLTKTKSGYFCSFQTPSDLNTFSETDTYEISLCHGQDEEDDSSVCELLDDEYVPIENIQPNAPCCLTVDHNSSQYHFTWRSTYEEQSLYNNLGVDLQYQLRLRRRGDKVILYHISSDRTHVSLDDGKFVAGTEYSARVRSCPGQISYMGQWSEWSAEFHWKAMNYASPSKALPKSKFLSELGKKVFIPLCVTVFLVLLLCYVPVKKWRQNVFIPTPAPYFDTLYGDCKGDFKSWVVAPDGPAELLKAEETLHIDTVTKCAENQKEEYLCPCPRRPTDVHAYNNVSVAVCDASLLGLPYAVSTMAPRSSSEGPAGDYSNLLPEDGPPWYCNDYCSLSSFQHPGSAPPEHQRSF